MELGIGDSDRRRKVSKGELGRSKAEARGATTKTLPLYRPQPLGSHGDKLDAFWNVQTEEFRGNRNTDIRGNKSNTNIEVAYGIEKLAMSPL